MNIPLCCNYKDLQKSFFGIGIQYTAIHPDTAPSPPDQVPFVHKAPEDYFPLDHIEKPKKTIAYFDDLLKKDPDFCRGEE